MQTRWLFCGIIVDNSISESGTKEKIIISINWGINKEQGYKNIQMVNSLLHR